MRFRFCGDLDCPDWVLAEINILSKITSVKMKLLAVQVLKVMLGHEIDYEKVHKLTSDAKFELGDIKASIAALSFILSSAAKYSVDADTLSNELQQLGLPKVSSLDSVQWRVDYILSSSELEAVNEPSVQLKLGVKEGEAKDGAKPVAFTLTADKFRVLLHELKQAKEIMENLEKSRDL